jgi:hypothetical protein
MICEAEELSEQLFEDITFDYDNIQIEKNYIKQAPLYYPTEPIETREKGIYELDMKKLQESHPEISSKMAIIPFLNNVKFYSLTIYCNHVMPWFDFELPRHGCQFHVTKLGDQGYQVDIEKNCNNIET